MARHSLALQEARQGLQALGISLEDHRIGSGAYRAACAFPGSMHALGGSYTGREAGPDDNVVAEGVLWGRGGLTVKLEMSCPYCSHRSKAVNPKKKGPPDEARGPTQIYKEGRTR